MFVQATKSRKNGTPSAVGNTTVVLSATNPAGTVTKSLMFAISPQAPVITSSNTANGTAGQAFSHLITATNGPVVFSAVGMPAGVTLNATSGLVGGAPTSDGTYAVRVTAKMRVVPTHKTSPTPSQRLQLNRISGRPGLHFPLKCLLAAS